MMWNFCKKIANGMELQRQGSRKAACALWERGAAAKRCEQFSYENCE